VRTSEVAAQAQVNIETLRYYERRGLLRKPERTKSGYRVYTVDAVRVVRFIKRAQNLGFSLNDAQELLNLAEGGPAPCEEARLMAANQIVGLQQRIDQLVAMRDALTRLMETCEEPRADRHCPILSDIQAGARPARSAPIR
jgi:Hg(II)-responsive transcriptional regulator